MRISDWSSDVCSSDLDTGNALTLDLTNPLGNTLARVSVLPGLATLTRSNGEREQAAHPDALVEQVLGSPMPVAGLRDWLQGRVRSEEHTSELQSLMRISYAVFCLNKKQLKNIKLHYT